MILGICHPGLESLAVSEIEYLSGVKGIIEKGAVLFDTNSEDIAKVCYRSQTLLGAMVLDIPDMESFAVRSIKVDSDAIGIEEEVGEQIIKKTKARVDLKNPEVRIIAYVVDDKRYIGADLYGFDPSKRDYRAQTTPGTLKSTIYANLLWFAGFKDQVLLDPFGQSGCIPIEAALMATKRSPNFYRKDEFALSILDRFDDINDTCKVYCYDRLINKAKTNAKLAGVAKNINFGSVVVKDLDIKFGENEIDIIATQPPQMSKYADKKKIDAIYHDLFYQSSYILKGCLCIVALNSNTEMMLKENAKKHGFSMAERKSTTKGDSTVRFLKFEKALNKKTISKDL